MGRNRLRIYIIYLDFWAKYVHKVAFFKFKICLFVFKITAQRLDFIVFV